MVINRREFAAGFVASAIARKLAGQQTYTSAVTLGRPDVDVPEDFLGLSYESAQLANPGFFSATNKGLIALFRDLASTGNLRIGGGSSEFTTFSEAPPAVPMPFEVFGPDTSKTTKSGTVTTTLALDNLRGFLDATNWSCLYGLNLGQGTIENAVREAGAAFRILGQRLVAFQIGNEPDSFRNRYRPADYTPSKYLEEWNRFRSAIAAVMPEARFAGPDISNKLPYLTAFAREAPQHRDVVLLTSHYYAMGPAGNPGATIDNLLDPDPKLTTLKLSDVHFIEEAREMAQLPYRMSEGNSCWNGGEAGVSDTFASALWAADYSFTCAARGWAGVNFHGGGSGVYSPIVGSPSAGFLRRPEFYGIQFARSLLGKRLGRATVAGASPRVSAYVLEKETGRELVLINKTPFRLDIVLPDGMRASERLFLHAESIDAKEGIRLTKLDSAVKAVASSGAYSATLYRLRENSGS